MPTKIEWADETWNPVTGCTPISRGCKHCYAARMANRQRGRNGYAADDPFHVTFHADRLRQPLQWREPRCVFVCSMGDLFHEDVSFEWVLQIFAVMIATPWNRYLVLTKRPARMQAFYDWWRVTATKEHYLCLQVGKALDAVEFISEAVLKRGNDYYLEHCDQSRRGRYDAPVPWPPPNVGLGVTVEHAEYRGRIDRLREIPAAMRFVSCEPLLGKLPSVLVARCPHCGLRDFRFSAELAPDGTHFGACANCSVPRFGDEAPGHIDWIIAGGESGPGARAMDRDWARSLRDRCQAAGVPFFFKQWGAWASLIEVAGPGRHHHFDNGNTVRRVGNKAAGRMLDGRTWDERPEPFFSSE